MKYLYKVFYENDHTQFIDQYNKRVSFDSAKHFNLEIKPIDQPNVFGLYYIPTNDMLNKISQIHRVSSNLNNIYKALPPVAKEQFIYELLVEELYHTNELEGVKSTKKEIANSVKEVTLNTNEKKRFHSMVKAYFDLINEEITLPETPNDIRKIYDDITKGEIDKKELPDGEIFRNDINYVLKKSGTGKVIHRGIIPESKIISESEQLLAFLNHSNEIPLLIKIAIGHYFFGYIHPFYDGNGRTSRFISSMYLAKELDPVSALSLSRGCNTFIKEYLESFEVTNSIMNRGEMNFFIETFLFIILKTLQVMYSELKEKDELLRTAIEKIEKEPKLDKYSSNHKDFMFILAQNYFFQFSDGVTVKEISNVLNVSRATVRKIAKELLDVSLIQTKGKRPIFYTIQSQYFETN